MWQIVQTSKYFMTFVSDYKPKMSSRSNIISFLPNLSTPWPSMICTQPDNTMADRSPVLIRPCRPQDKSKQELSYLLSRLLQQKGGSLNVTEKSLEGEIRNGASQTEELDSIADKDEEETTKAEQMQVMRTEILKATK